MLCRRHGFGGVLYRCLDRPALLIEDIELHGDYAGFFRIISCQQTDAKVGFADASTRIDAWPKSEAEIGANRRLLETSALDQCSDADFAVMRHELQTQRDKGTVQTSDETSSELQELIRRSYDVFC